MNTQSDNLPALPTGFGDRFFQGAGAKCVDGRWRLDGVELTSPKKLVAMGTRAEVQRWLNGVADVIPRLPNGELPDVDELNASIPESEWEAGFDGNPKPPHVLTHAAYLLDPTDASVYTFANSTTGARIAVGRLADKIAMMQALRGARVVPIVQLSSKEMKTKFGTKMRPDFVIVEWRELGGGGNAQPAIEHKPGPKGGSDAASFGADVKPVTSEEALNDSIDF